jgi:hypothetical protein
MKVVASLTSLLVLKMAKTEGNRNCSIQEHINFVDSCSHDEKKGCHCCMQKNPMGFDLR